MILLNGEKVDIRKFPNGESYIDLNSLSISGSLSEISFKFESDEDVIHLIFLKKHLDEQKIKCNLLMPYIPYSRMDRTNNTRVFTLKYICEIINDLNFDKVVVCEPHSDVSIALLDRVVVTNTSTDLLSYVLELVENKDVLYIVYPDAGAEKRYSSNIKYQNTLTANKERDFETGRIKKLTINCDKDISGCNVIIVDDLCSKGGTFMLTAQKLKEMGVEDIYLVVAHCEDTIFDGEILKTDLIKAIFTTDSILSKNHEKFKIRKIFGGK